MPPTTPAPTTTTTIDPVFAPPLLQRTYNTHTNGMGEPVVILMFVVAVVFAVMAGYLLGRVHQAAGRHGLRGV